MLAQFSSKKYVSPFLSSRRLTRARSFGDFSFSEAQDEDGDADERADITEDSTNVPPSSLSRTKRHSSFSASSSSSFSAAPPSSSSSFSASSSSSSSFVRRSHRVSRSTALSTGLEKFRFGKQASQDDSADRASSRMRRHSESKATKTNKRQRGRPRKDFTNFSNQQTDEQSDVNSGKSSSTFKRAKRCRSPDSPLVRAMSSPLSSPLKATLDSFRYATTTPSSSSTSSRNLNFDAAGTNSPHSCISEDSANTPISCNTPQTSSSPTSEISTPVKSSRASASSSSQTSEAEMSPEFPPAKIRRKPKTKLPHVESTVSSAHSKSHEEEHRISPSTRHNCQSTSSSPFPSNGFAYSGGIDTTDSSSASPEEGSTSIFFPNRKPSSRSATDSPEVTPQKVDNPGQQPFSLQGLAMVFKYPR